MDTPPAVMPSFFRLPSERCDPARAKYLIVPVPYEGTVCFLRGTINGPEAILAVSDQVERFDEELRIDYTKAGIATLPPIQPQHDVTPEEEFQLIYETVRERRLFQTGQFPIFLGGEHSITPPIVKAAAEKNADISVLQFDAHADLRNSYTGGKYSHASAMRRVLDFTPNLVQVGIRSFSEEEYTEKKERIDKIITPAQVCNDYNGSIDSILYNLTDKVYITVDIDAFDPAFAPGTGTPEPGGLDWFQVTGILRRVCETKKVIGADIVETAPFGGNNVITEFLAARLTAKLIAYTANPEQ
ncbi:MAG: agmatinase [Planctomycetaceae bacterium]|jgi:agmatinase|nr:agmatinase [Planctomycetaceae bacterium]